MKEIVVLPTYDGKKLNTCLLHELPELSMNLFYKTLRKKDIRINGTKVSENKIVHTGDLIQVFISDAQLIGDLNKWINIIYEDEYILALNKPAGIEVVGNDFSLTNILSKQKNKAVFPCHRLDRNTCGIVLFAKDENTLQILLEKFKNREIEKIYHAKVYGIPKNNEQILEAYLFKDNKKSVVYISDFPKKGYVKIQTAYTVLQTNKKENTSLLEVKLLTGKTHQIRAHLAHIGLPIIGDGKYGDYKVNQKFHEKVQNLCSYSICFKFSSPSLHLEYLNGKLITVENKKI